MESIARRLTDYILSKNVIKSENYNIYVYGFQTALETAICFMTGFIIALLLRGIPEFLFFSFFFLLMRSYSGGLHLKTFRACFITSCLLLAACILAAKYIHLHYGVSLAIFLAAVLVIVATGPVDHPNKKIDEHDNVRYKLRSNVILVIGILTAIFLFATKNSHFLELEAITFVIVAVTGLLGKRYNKSTGA